MTPSCVIYGISLALTASAEHRGCSIPYVRGAGKFLRAARLPLAVVLGEVHPGWGHLGWDRYNPCHRYPLVTDLRYPIGKYAPPAEITDAQRAAWIDEVAHAPDALRMAVRGLTAEQLDTPYRPGGWTVRQVVHHLPDSHLNAYTRFKLALTEEEPTIKPYAEDRWAELADTREVPIEVSLTLLEALHERWVALLRAMSAADFRRTYRHPEHGRIYRLDEVLGLYAWHGRHHTAHITTLRQQKGW